MGCRSIEKCVEAAQQIRREDIVSEIIPMQVELSSLHSVDSFAKSIIEYTNRLDIIGRF